MTFDDAGVSVSIIDSHTEGEPTRVILDGWPALEGATMAERQHGQVEANLAVMIMVSSGG